MIVSCGPLSQHKYQLINYKAYTCSTSQINDLRICDAVSVFDKAKSTEKKKGEFAEVG